MCELWIWSMRVGRWEKTSPQPSHRHVTVSPGSAGGAEDGPGEPRSSTRNAETSPASLADDESSRITDDCENDGDGERSSAGDGEYVELACAIVERHKTNKWPARCSRRRPAAVCRCLVQLACRRSLRTVCSRQGISVKGSPSQQKLRLSLTPSVGPKPPQAQHSSPSIAMTGASYVFATVYFSSM